MALMFYERIINTMNEGLVGAAGVVKIPIGQTNTVLDISVQERHHSLV